MTKLECVRSAIAFRNWERVPVWNFNADQKEGDILWYDLRICGEETQTGPRSEWGYVWNRLEDGTMGQPLEAVITTEEAFDAYRLPNIDLEKRFEHLEDFLKKSEGYYRLAMLNITGFTTYTFLRGFENAMMDFALRDPKALRLLKDIFEFEKNLICACGEAGFHGFHLGDDWGTQRGMMISPELWEEIFAPLYQDMVDYAHGLGMQIWFHSCGNFTAIVERLSEIGVDVINIAQPNTVDVVSIGKKLKGKQCFLIPLSYQTTSISGTVEEIYAEAQKLYDLLSTPKGGFIGYVEEYSCMGMSEENYNACREAFARLKKTPTQGERSADTVEIQRKEAEERKQ